MSSYVPSPHNLMNIVDSDNCLASRCREVHFDQQGTRRATEGCVQGGYKMQPGDDAHYRNTGNLLVFSCPALFGRANGDCSCRSSHGLGHALSGSWGSSMGALTPDSGRASCYRSVSVHTNWRCPEPELGHAYETRSRGAVPST